MLTLGFRPRIFWVVTLLAGCGGGGAGSIDGDLKHPVADGGVIVLPDGAVVTADGGGEALQGIRQRRAHRDGICTRADTAERHLRSLPARKRPRWRAHQL